ncbi:ABC transporter substrate-binding protein, partial [Roseomonas sp. NAR14]
LRVVAPPEMVANLRSGNFDGFLGPDPVNQRAVYDGVGFIHLLSREIWDGHPCCSFGIGREVAQAAPNTYHAMLRAIVDATAYAAKPENRKEIAAAIAPANYLNQPEVVVQQVLTGTFADGLGTVRRVPERVGFAPMPWDSFAIWILTQMKRWGQIRGDVDYAAVARQVYLATDAERAMREAGLDPARASGRTIVVMGRAFDPAKPEDYVSSFAIRRS